MAGLLSYLVPGLGQIVQGRVAKGVLFLVCIYTLFFYGMYNGRGSVTLEDEHGDPKTYNVTSNVYLYDGTGLNERGNPTAPTLPQNLYTRPQFVGQFCVGVAAWPAIWQYLHYDRTKDADPVLGTFERQPADEAINAVQTSGDKRLELAWVFTVIAGVLNILVIYDAAAGPAFQTPASANPLEKAA
jgi:hypothetical protein